MAKIALKIVATFACAVSLSACVSASLDDVGLESAAAPQASQLENSEPIALNQDLTTLRTSSQQKPPIAQSSVQSETIQAPIQSQSTLAPQSTSTLPTGTDTPNIEVPSTTSSTSLTQGTSEQGRHIGIGEIRAKAAASGNTKPNINADYAPATKHLTKEEQRLKKAELHAEALAASGAISQDELLLRKRRIAALSKKARTHYNQAVRQIKQ